MDSLFMHDDSEGNQGYEHMLDFQMSWVMRVPTNDEIKTNNPVLYTRCLSLLKKLIGKKNSESIDVESVRVWKQWKRIDVIAEVKIRCNGNIEKHVVIIEDKAYTMIHDDQLNRYERTVSDEYDGTDFIRHYWVITFFSPCEDGYKIMKSMCEESKGKWNLLSYDDVFEDYTPTGSEHFDDFWINKW